MYTTVPQNDVVDVDQPKPGDPLPEIIDHRAQPKGPRWVNRHRKEHLPYDTLRKHRDVLLEEEFKYKKQIRELQKEREELVGTYESTYQENQKLKSIIEYGPDAAKLKQLAKDKKDQKGMIEHLEDENKALNVRLKELERIGDPLKNELINKEWNDTLDKVRKKRAEEDAIPTQGPFLGGKIFKKKRIMIDDTRMQDIDAYDLQLDTIEKETQKLLNKINQLKREKERIDYTLMMGKGAVTRNAVIANAIGEKLNRDLNKYAIRLEKLKLKHKRAKEFVDVVQSPPTPIRKVNELETPKAKASKTYKTNKLKRFVYSPGASSTEDNSVALLNGNSGTSPVSSRLPFTKAQKRTKKMNTSSKEVAWTPKKFDRPSTYSGLHESARVYSAEKSERNSGKRRSENDIPQSDKKKEKHRIISRSEGNPTDPRNNRKHDSKRNSVDNKLNQTSHSDGEHADKFEPITKIKEGDVTTRNRVPLKSAKTNKTFDVNPSSQRNSDHVGKGVKKQSTDANQPIQFKQAYNEKRQAVSPEHINFNTKGRNVGGADAWQLIGNTGIRREYMPRYLDPF